jgi:DNA-directed RNA polymerase specialized sigma24 family protein
VFHYIEEISLSEVAEREGVPVGTIKSRLHGGRGKLLELLRGKR